MKHKNTLSTLVVVMAIFAAFLLYSKNQKSFLPPDKQLPDEITTTSLPALPATDVSGAVPPTTTLKKSGSLNDYLKSMDPKADWRINKADDGRVIAISGGQIPAQMGSPAESLRFAQTIAEKTGVSGSQIVASPTVLEATPYSKAQQFDQEVSGYSVFGGYMKVFTKIPGGDVYYIANETKNAGEPLLTINYSFSDAKSIIQKQYAKSTGLVIEGNPEKPVLFVTAPGKSELTWETSISIKSPKFDRRHLLVSAVTGKILKDTSLVMH